MVGWLAATATGVFGCFVATWRRDAVRAAWMAALGALPGLPLMLGHAVTSHWSESDAGLVLALFGIIFSPIAFLESGRVAMPLRVLTYIDVARVLLLGSWAASSFCAAMTAVYI